MSKKSWRYRRPLFADPVQVSPKASKKKSWRVMPIIWHALKRTCMVLGAFMLVSMVIGMLGTLRIASAPAPSLPQEMVLYLKFNRGLTETPEEPSLSDPFTFIHPTVHEMVEAVDRAATDTRIKGIVARMEGGGYSPAHVQEVRAAIKRFRETGKFTYIYSSSYGDTGGFGGYYLASSFENLWVQPMGIVSVNGISAEVPFFRSLLDTVGVYPQFLQKEEYKTAYESLSNQSMSDQNREMTERLIGDIRSAMVKDIAEDRSLEPKAFESLVDQGFFTAQDAEKKGLVTTAGYADVLVAEIKEQVTGDREGDKPIFVDLRAYLSDARKKGSSAKLIPESFIGPRPRVALISVAGTIMPSGMKAHSSVLIQNGIAAADEIAPAIMEAADDEHIEAIVLRVDSPGGSPTASESILRAVQRAKEKGKPVIVSMGPTAASGGYWVSAYADHIFVLPTTITGSIGVLGGKVSARELWNTLGINWERIQWGDNAALFSLNTPFSKSEAKQMDAMLENIYDGFLDRVSKGRKMEREEVRKIAGGRVWSGQRAVQIGLADAFGGLAEALDYTASVLGQNTREDLKVIVMPRPRTPFERFIDLLSRNGQVLETLRIQSGILQFFAPISQYIGMAAHPEVYRAYDPIEIK